MHAGGAMSKSPAPTPTAPATIRYQGLNWRLTFIKTPWYKAGLRQCVTGCCTQLKVGDQAYKPMVSKAATLAGYNYKIRMCVPCAGKVGATP